MAAVVVKPFKKLSTVLVPRHAAAIIGAPGAMATKAPIVPTLAASSDEFIRCRPGSCKGFEDIRPASLRNATTEPVNVTPPRNGLDDEVKESQQHRRWDLPMRTPKYPVTRCKVDISAILASTLPILVRTAANPTTECNAATVCGSSVAVIRRPINKP